MAGRLRIRSCKFCGEPFRPKIKKGEYCYRENCYKARHKKWHDKWIETGHRSTTKKPESNPILKQSLSHLKVLDRAKKTGEPSPLVQLSKLNGDKFARAVNRMLAI